MQSRGNKINFWTCETGSRFEKSTGFSCVLRFYCVLFQRYTHTHHQRNDVTGVKVLL